MSPKPDLTLCAHEPIHVLVITYVPQLSLGLRDLVYPEAAKNSPAYGR